MLARGNPDDEVLPASRRLGGGRRVDVQNPPGSVDDDDGDRDVGERQREAALGPDVLPSDLGPARAAVRPTTTTSPSGAPEAASQTTPDTTFRRPAICLV